MDFSAVKEYIKKEVPDWDDEVMATARFKAFSGQRSDWEPKFHFWRDLILKISRHFGLLIVHPSQVKNIWFNRGGLVPLCIEHVLFVMYNEGDIIPIGDLEGIDRRRFSQLLSKVRNLIARSRMTSELMLDDRIIITPLLKDKAAEVVKHLSETHWTSSCVITMKKFQNICGGSTEASSVLSYLSRCGNVQYFSITKKELIEGLKVSLTPAAVSSISSLDHDVLHLIWTTETLQQQLDLIDKRYEGSRKSALASLKSGNKKLALRHVKEMKLGTESREKCTSLLHRVEEVLNAIADAESTKKVSEAIQIGAQAMKENQINFEEVRVCLEELEESFESQKQVEKALGSTLSYADIEDEDIEDEFNKLELELESEKSQVSTSEKTSASESADSLSNILSNLRLTDGPVTASEIPDTVAKSKKHESKDSILEPA